MGKNGIKIEVARLDERLNNVEDFVKKMEENHLPHIYNRLNRIERMIAYSSGGIMIIIVIAQMLL